MANKFISRMRRVLSAVLISLSVLQFTGCASIPDISAATSSAAETASSALVQSAGIISGVSSTASSVSSAAEKQAASVEKASVQKAVSNDVKTIKMSNYAFNSTNTQSKTVTRSLTAAPSYSAVTRKDGYNALSSQLERTFYDLISASVYKISESKSQDGYYTAGDVYVIGKLSEAQIITVIQAYFDDNPQVFWITNTYSYAYSGNSTYLRMYSYISASDCNSAITAFSAKLQAAVDAMPSGLSEFDREEYIFDYIVKNCSYDDAAVTDQSGRWQSFTSYGAVVNGSAVCEGYSKAMQLLCGYAGLNCVVTEGTAGGVRHMWNAVCIDGLWYYLDVTWCDGSFVVYNYFNIPESTLKKTHVIAPLVSSLAESQINNGDQFNLFLQQCSSSKESYYNVKGIKVSGTDSSGDSAAVSSIESGLKSGQTSFAFLISGDSDYDTAVKSLLSSEPYKINTYFYEALSACGFRPQNSKISYVEDKDNSGLNVKVALA